MAPVGHRLAVAIPVFHRTVVAGTSSEVGSGLGVIGPIGEIYALEGFGAGVFLGFAWSEQLAFEPTGETFASLFLGDGERTYGPRGDGVFIGCGHHAGGAAERTYGSGFQGIIDRHGTALFALHLFLLLAPVEALGVECRLEVHLTDFVFGIGAGQLASVAAIVAMHTARCRVEEDRGTTVRAFLIGFFFSSFRIIMFFRIVVIFCHGCTFFVFNGCKNRSYGWMCQEKQQKPCRPTRIISNFVPKVLIV